MKRGKLKLSIQRVVLAAVATLLLAVATPVAAQQKNSSGLSISPTRVELSLKPGEADKIDITLKNVTEGDITARPYVNDFESDNATGNPRIIVDTSKKSSTSIRDYVAGLDDVPLKAGETKHVTVFVQMPASIPPGGYFGIIRYLAIPGGSNAPQNGEVALSASVSTLVLIEVPGNIKQQVQLTNVLAYRGDSSGVFFTSPPDHVGVELKNFGNGFAKPFGRVVVKNMSGKEVYSYEVNNITPRANILPNSTRIFKDEIKNVKSPGRYTILASISYGNGSDVLVYKKAVWYIPFWMLIIILLILALLVAGIWIAYRRYRGVSRPSRKRR